MSKKKRRRKKRYVGHCLMCALRKYPDGRKRDPSIQELRSTSLLEICDARSEKKRA